jgi:hypothetical protein
MDTQVEQTAHAKTGINPKGAGRPKGSVGKTQKELLEAAAQLKSKAWHNGRVYISVSQENIDTSLAANSSHCVIASAIKQCIPSATFVAIDIQSCRFTQDGVRYCFLTPAAAREIIINTDQGNRELIQPCEFSMKPVHVSKAGKSRRHVPDNATLKAIGLRLAEEQAREPVASEAPKSCLEEVPKVEQTAPDAEKGLAEVMGKDAPVVRERDAALGALDFEGARQSAAGNPAPEPENTSKSETGEEASAGNPAAPVEPPKPRRKRVARQKISAPTKGCVPVSLGGRALPTSILSRREYGMRVLKR